MLYSFDIDSLKEILHSEKPRERDYSKADRQVRKGKHWTDGKADGWQISGYE
ncbi:MAG: hypothetical protein HFJ41_08315 [Clostridia bacterium]|nr:hypothetical protein [Clostridia bacterium]